MIAMATGKIDLRQRLQQELDETLAEIKRLEERLERKGDYGVCEVCGNQIDPARLAILPHTKRCITCAQKR
jgi:DnaK suppressor protein